MTRPAALKSPSRERIVDVAEKLFAERGLGGVGLAEVAERAGLGKASLFHHFPTKAHLYGAVMAGILIRLEDELIRALAAGGSPAQRLDRWIDTVIDVFAAHPNYPRLLIRALVEYEELPDGLRDGKKARDAMNRLTASALGLLKEGMESGVFRRASAAHTLQALIGATIHPLATGRFGEELVGGSLFSSSQLSRRKTTLKKLIRSGIVAETTQTQEGAS